MRAPVDFHHAARDTGAVIAGIRDDQLSWPTPSPLDRLVGLTGRDPAWIPAI